MTYTLSEIENHWFSTSAMFKEVHNDLITLFSEVIPISFEVARSLEGRKELPENCTHLLLSKIINHSLSMYTLVEKGLLIDASLSARNAIETFLMLELFATDAHEEYFKQWSNGKEFKPTFVRNKLGTSLNAVVKEVKITFDDDFYESVKLAYTFFSDITHSNLKSAEYSVSVKDKGHLELPTGGNIEDKEALIRCLFAVTCSGLIRAILISSAIFSLKLLEEISPRLTHAQHLLNDVSNLQKM
ncbi:MAG: hypothetical protein AB2595_05305 [Candidatus Thiodiazotropha endolucinida]